MKHILSLLLCLCSAGVMAQHCPNVSWTLPDPVVCDVNYGDASGNSPWNWEIDRLDPDYCKMWYARTGPGQITAMGSPFLYSPSSMLGKIADAKDFTKAKGWVLLTRNFGCERVTNFPYFALYNTWSGILRVFVYQPAGTAQSSGLMVIMTPFTPSGNAPYPALTAMGDPVGGSVEHFKNENSDERLGSSVIAVGEQAGPASWTMAEFQMGFDPNVGIYDYKGSGLNFKIYNVKTFDMKGTIKGGMVSGSSSQIFNYSFKPTQEPQPAAGGLQKWIATGQKIVKVAKTSEDARKEINKTTTEAAKRLMANPNDSTRMLYKIGKTSLSVAKAFSDSSDFGQTASAIFKTIAALGAGIDLIGNIMGIFSETAPSITYSSINLQLEGSLEALDVGQSFMIKVPGSMRDPNNPTDYDNRPYYDCPLGIAALKNIPRADLITYERAKSLNGYGLILSNHQHKSYRLKNDLVVAVNEKAGLELVSAQIAFLGEILPIPQGQLFQGEPSYLPLTEHSNGKINFMLPEFQNFRYHMVNYDSLGFHTYRTSFVDIGCANGMTFNVLEGTRVYLRLIAILKKKNDPAATPILFSKDYEISADNVTMPQATQDMYLSNTVGHTALPPYSNLTILPTFFNDVKLENVYLANGAYYQTDNDIYTRGMLISPSNAQNVILNAGSQITLSPGFEASWGTTFTAQINRYGYNLNCINPIVENYNPPGNCYNISAIPQFNAKDDKAELEPRNEQSVSVYPVPSNGNVIVEIKGLPSSTVIVSDLSGKTVHQQSLPNAVTNMNLKHLPNGIYFVKVIYPDKVIVKKIMLNK